METRTYCHGYVVSEVGKYRRTVGEGRLESEDEGRDKGKRITLYQIAVLFNFQGLEAGCKGSESA
jgi:hypothetical protein